MSQADSVSGEGSAKEARRKLKIGSQRETDPLHRPAPSAAEGPGAWSSDDLEGGPAQPGRPPQAPTMAFPPPRLDRLSPELQREIDEVLAGISLDELLAGTPGRTDKGLELEPEQRYAGTVVKVFREDVFFELPGGHEGVAPLKLFSQPPQVGATLEVLIRRFNPEDGLYELHVPGASVQVADWSDLEEGVVVEALVSGHNSGGLECQVNNIRGFIPLSQVALYRVEDLEEFVGQRLACVVTEADPTRRNLVLSRRAVLEREQAEAKRKLFESLVVGELREGVVRKIVDFGAFVDLGGLDGLVHVSKLSWDRVTHPRDVLEEGQRIRVKVEKVDAVTGKISLSLRDTLEHPWEKVEEKYLPNSIVAGTVSKIMDFGAFVRLEPGIEGLVHISELAHQRVTRVESVVKEGQRVEVKVLSVDPDAQRLSLSLKAVTPSAAGENAATQEEAPKPSETSDQPRCAQLRGGTDRKSGGEQFGLNW
jgi:small subunit ribosomal protein S1